MQKKMVYSENNGFMVLAGFTFKGEHYTWDEENESYWADNKEIYSWFFDVPMMAIPDMEPVSLPSRFWEPGCEEDAPAVMQIPAWMNEPLPFA